MYPPEAGRRDPESTDVPPPTIVSAFVELKAMSEVWDDRPTITPMTAEAEDKTETASKFCLLTKIPTRDRPGINWADRLGRNAKVSKADDARIPEYDQVG